MGRHKAYDRDEVLRRATRLFWEKGFEGTHLAELVEATGVNRFSLYAEFGGKAGLFEAALARYVEQLDGIGRHLEAEPLGLANLRAYYEAFLEFDFFHGCFAINTIREKAVVPPEAFCAVEAMKDGLEAALGRNLAAAAWRGELDPALDVETVTRFLTAFEMGLLTYGIVTPDPAARARMIALLGRLLGFATGDAL